jgi:hypothetical protein
MYLSPRFDASSQFGESVNLSQRYHIPLTCQENGASLMPAR